MSTELGSIEGRHEVVVVDPWENERKRLSEYRPSTLHLVRFSGGPKGVMLSLAVQQSDGLWADVQLTTEQVKELVDTLRK